MKQLSMRRYLAGFAALLAATLALVVSPNAAIDPFRVFPPLGVEALRPYETQRGSRTYRAEALRRRDVRALVLGSSRAEVGFEVGGTPFEPDVFYNSGLRGTNLYEVEKVFDYARSVNDLEVVILSVDFLMFNEQRTVGEDFAQSRFAPDLTPLDYYLEKLLSERVSRASFDLIQARASGERATFRSDGSSDISALFAGQNPRLSFERRLRRFVENPEAYGRFRYGRDRVGAFGRIAARCVEDGIRLVVVIPPVHALQLELIRAMGLWPLFERWKRDLVDAAGGAPGVEIFDFTGYNRTTTEPVPKRTQRDAGMSGYWESSHFKPEVGARVMERVFAERGPGEPVDSFGVRLTAQTLPAHLRRIGRERAAWSRQNLNEVVWVQRIVEDQRP